MGEGERPQVHKGGGKRRRRGGDSEGWSGGSGSSDVTSDAESEEAEEEPARLTALPWGTQESGASGLRRGARAGGSGNRKAISGTAEGGRYGASMGRENITAGKKDATRVGNVTTPREWRETLGAVRPPEWAPIPTERSGRRGDARPPEWRKTPGGYDTE